MAAAEPAARGFFRELITSFAAAGGGDFVDDVAVPFPCVTFLDLLGLPVSDLPDLLRWKNALGRDIASPDAERVANAIATKPEVDAYFSARITERMNDADPPDDVLRAQWRCFRV